MYHSSISARWSSALRATRVWNQLITKLVIATNRPPPIALAPAMMAASLLDMPPKLRRRADAALLGRLGSANPPARAAGGAPQIAHVGHHETAGVLASLRCHLARLGRSPHPSKSTSPTVW